MSASGDAAAATAERRHSAWVFVTKIVVGTTLLWYGWRAAGVASPAWAIISLIVVTEPDLGKATANFRVRSINTVVGCLIACVALLALGPTLPALLISAAAAVLAGTLVRGYPDSWRLGPATATLLIAAAFQEPGLGRELKLVALRAAEVLTGSGIALLLALVYTGWRRWADEGQKPEG